MSDVHRRASTRDEARSNVEDDCSEPFSNHHNFMRAYSVDLEYVRP